MKRFELIFMILQVPVDFVMIILAGLTAYYLRFTDWALALKPILFHLTPAEFMQYVIGTVPMWLVIFAVAGLYTPGLRRRFATDILRIFLGALVGLAFIAMYILFTQQFFDSRFLVAAGSVCVFVYVALGRIALRGMKAMLYRAGMGLRRVVIVGADSIASQLQDLFGTRRELGYEVVGVYKSFSDDVAKKIQRKKVDEIIVTNPRGSEASSLDAFEYATDMHIGFRYSADLFATLSANMSVHPLGGIPIVDVRPTRLEGWGRVVKRLFDVVFSLVALVIVSPVYIIILLLIMLETGFPILYKNERVGVHGKKFFTYKFRSMYQKDSTGSQFGVSGKEAEARERELIEKQNSKKGPIYKIQNDPRVTPFGRFLRRWSLDEFPQFFNVLAGSMSVVGPRPHQPREVAGYTKQHRLAFGVKPGITGLAQISGRSDLTYEEEMRLDILYIEKWSLFLDIIVVVKTPFILFRRRKVL